MGYSSNNNSQNISSCSGDNDNLEPLLGGKKRYADTDAAATALRHIDFHNNHSSDSSISVINGIRGGNRRRNNSNSPLVVIDDRSTEESYLQRRRRSPLKSPPMERVVSSPFCASADVRTQSVIILCFLSVIFTFFGQFMKAFSVEYSLKVSAPPFLSYNKSGRTFEFNMWKGAEELAKVDMQWLSILVYIWSGFWPYVKLVFILLHVVLEKMDASEACPCLNAVVVTCIPVVQYLGKWAFLDVCVVMVISVVLHVDRVVGVADFSIQTIVLEGQFVFMLGVALCLIAQTILSRPTRPRIYSLIETPFGSANHLVDDENLYYDDTLIISNNKTNDRAPAELEEEGGEEDGDDDDDDDDDDDGDNTDNANHEYKRTKKKKQNNISTTNAVPSLMKQRRKLSRVSSSPNVIGIHAIWPPLALLAVLFIQTAGNFTPFLNVKASFAPLAVIEDRSFSIIEGFNDMTKTINGAGKLNTGHAIFGYIFVTLMPVISGTLLLTAWLLPGRPRLREKALHWACILREWCLVDVFWIASIVSMFELPEISAYIAEEFQDISKFGKLEVEMTPRHTLFWLPVVIILENLMFFHMKCSLDALPLSLYRR